MIDVNELTTFLGWCTLVNMSVLAFAALFITVFKSFAINLHSHLFGLNAAELPTLYFKYLANYKIGILLFNLAPYLALKLMV
ncbi:MAG: hypothetical protein V5786_09570 [Psychromonas sp.]